MSDIEHHRWCATNERWSRMVDASTPGKKYCVSYGQKLQPENFLAMGYTCDCPAFKFGKGGECKHILAVKHERCAWNASAADGTPEPPLPRKATACPKCGGELLVIKVAV